MLLSSALGATLVAGIIILTLLIALVWTLFRYVMVNGVDKEGGNCDKNQYETLAARVDELKNNDGVKRQQKSESVTKELNERAKSVNVQVLLSSSSAASVLERVNTIDKIADEFSASLSDFTKQNDMLFAKLNPAITSLNRLNNEVNETGGNLVSDTKKKSVEMPVAEARYNALSSTSKKERGPIYESAQKLNDRLQNEFDDRSFYRRTRETYERSGVNDEPKVLESADKWMETNQGFIARLFIRKTAFTAYEGPALELVHSAVIYPRSKLDDNKVVVVTETLVRIALQLVSSDDQSVLLIRKSVGPWTYAKTLIDDQKGGATIVLKSKQFQCSISLVNDVSFVPTWRDKVLNVSDIRYHLLLLVGTEALNNTDEAFAAVGEQISYLTTIDRSFTYGVKQNVVVFTNLVLERLLATSSEPHETILAIKMAEYTQ